MIYKINELATLSGVSTRTLRYYHEIGLLIPETIDTNGYRLYGSKQVDQLQEILFYRELGISLIEIKRILIAPNYNRLEVLDYHLSALIEKKEQIEILIKNVTKTIHSVKEGTLMSNKEKFEGFKQEIINKNESKYGKELREKYGNEVIDESNQKLKGMNEKQWEDALELSQLIDVTLYEAFIQGDPSSEIAQQACDLHRQWICMYWKNNTYTKEAHKALAQMYVEDERFTQYYDRIATGCTKFLRDAIFIYCSK